MKKVLSVFLAALMIFAMIPTTVFAANGPAITATASKTAVKENTNMKAAGKALNKAFGYMVFIALILGGLAFFGFVAAFIMGPEAGGALGVAIKGKYFPWVIRFGTLTILTGLISMYLNGEEALSLKSDKAEAEAELAEIQANQE